MPGIDDARDRIEAADRALEERTAEIGAATVRVVEQQRLVERLRRVGDEDERAKAERDLELEEAAQGEARAALLEARAAARVERVALVDALDEPEELLRLLASSRPVALLPIQLQARYARSEAGALELRVRIYPGELHDDRHEPELTDDERTWGEDFWSKVWAAGTDRALAVQAWTGLCRRFGPPRAAWVATALEPLNDPPGAPQFPAAPRRAAAWTRAAQTRVLPDRFVAIGYRDGGRVFAEWGAPVADPLITGPSPLDSTPDPTADDVLDAPGMSWMIDFDDAVAVGMGLRVALADDGALERLVVLGVRGTLTPTASSERLATLLAAHRFTDGVELLPQGTPTNNTADGQAGFASRDVDLAAAFGREFDDPDWDAGDGTDGDLLARALGVDAAVLRRVAGGAEPGECDAAAMNAALWPAGWGYFLREMMAETFPDRGAIAQGRRHFVEWVRARGPLPVLRVGRQPYGVLPVTSLDRWAPAPGDGEPIDSALVGFLRDLREIWRESLGAVPRIGAGRDPEAALAAVLGSDATSSAYAARGYFGGDYLASLWWFWAGGAWNWAGPLLGGSWPDWWATWWEMQQRGAGAFLARLGRDWSPRLADGAFEPAALELEGPLVQPGALSATDPLADNYISFLLHASHEQIRDESYFGGAPPRALMYLVLRHSLLLAFGDAGLRVAEAIGWEEEGIRPRGAGEPELLEIDPALRTQTVWQVLAIDAGEGTSIGTLLDAAYRGERVGGIVAGPSVGAGAPQLQELRELRAALRALEDRPTRALERVFRETLDLSTHRLDAWISSFATKRLHELPGDGVHLGAYGWLEDLAPRAPGQPVEAPAGEEGSPIELDPANAGFVHAPSIGHAATAAVLRSGQLTHAGSDGVLAVDLSSARVRLAQWLLDGVRQGQPLAALLGYRFERELHAAQLDQYVLGFRLRAPFSVDKARADQGSTEAVAAANVVDGLRLVDLYRSNSLDFGASGMPPRTGADRDAVVARLEDLVGALDAVGDAVTAESVYQVVQGNHLRAGATLDAVARGEVPPPELEVARTPRSGVGATHRLAVRFSGDATPPAGWTATVRALAEPHLNRWAAFLLGDPAATHCEVEYRYETAAGAQQRRRAVALSELDLSALDVVFAALPAEQEQRSEIEQRVVLRALTNRPAGVPADAEVSVSLDPAARPAGSEASVAEVLELGRAARELFAAGRALEVRDLVLPEEGQAAVATLDTAELSGRADAVSDALDDTLAALPDAAATAATIAPAQVRAGLLDAAGLGVQGAVPLVATGAGAQEREILFVQGRSVAVELERRQAAVAAATTAFNDPLRPPPTPAEEVAYHLTRIREVLGAGFPVLPRFTPAAAQTAELERTFADGDALQDGDPFAAVTWLERAARVRAGVRRLESVLLYGAATGRRRIELSVGQLPYEPGDRWIGLPLAAGSAPRAGRLSLVVHEPEPIESGDPLAGLFVDDWVEVFPAGSHTTAVSFHFDAAGAEPPQAMLLAVPPDPQQTEWTLDTLEAIVLETLELAKLRMVDPDALVAAGQFLPALYFARNADGDTVATDFTRAAAPEVSG
jgi:hypothetical protein